MIKIILFGITLLYEGFEGGVIPSGWKIGNGGDPNYTWRIGQYGEYSPIEPPQEGIYYVVCDSTDTTVRFDDTLISPSVSIPLNAQKISLAYRITFMREAGDSTRCYILAKSFSSGLWSAWDTLKVYGVGPDSLFFSGVDSLDLSFYSTAESLKVAFHYFRNDSLYWVIIDSVHIEAKLSGDVGATAIISPREFFEANTPTPVIIEVQNFSDTVLSFYVKCEIRDSATETKVYRDSLNVTVSALKKDTFRLSDFTGTPETSYHILAWTELSTDPDNSNDTVSAYSTTHPFFGAIVSEIPLPKNDSGFNDLTFNTSHNLIYIVHELDTVYAIDESGSVISTYTIFDLSTDTTIIDVPYGIFYDKESGTFFTTQLGVPVSGGSFEWCYAVHYTNNFSFIDTFKLNSILGKYFIALADAKGTNIGFLHKAIFPSNYGIYKVDFVNKVKIDSLILSSPLYFLAGALEAIADTIFISAGAGLSEANLFKYDGTILANRTFEDAIRGITIEYTPSSEYIYGFINIGGYKLYKISIGLKWSEDVYEKRYISKKETKIFLPSILSPHSRMKFNAERFSIYNEAGRKLISFSEPITDRIGAGHLFKTQGIYFIKAGKNKFKVILLK